MQLEDAIARKRFIEEIDRNFCVCANAGAGKTTAIVERVVSIATHCSQKQDFSRLSQLAVVTYTNSAALELKNRCRLKIIKHLDTQNQTRQQTIRAFNQAFFGTIHGFCFSLLKEFGAYIGLPKIDDVLAEQTADIDNLWQLFLASEPNPEDLIHPEDFQIAKFIPITEIYNLAKKISLADADQILEQKSSPPNFENLNLTQLFELKGRASKERTASEASLNKWLHDIKNENFAGMPNISYNNDKWNKMLCTQLGTVEKSINLLAAKLSAKLAKLFAQFRIKKAQLTYADQIAFLYEILKNPKARDAIRQKKISVILDEAQDADADMFKVLTEITRPIGTELSNAWLPPPPHPLTQVLPPPPHTHTQTSPTSPPPLQGRFSFVGDSQQAIFSSRSDLRDYMRYVQAFNTSTENNNHKTPINENGGNGSNGEKLEFFVTMRCSAKVAENVDKVFHNFVTRDDLISFNQFKQRPSAEDGEVICLQAKGFENKIEDFVKINGSKPYWGAIGKMALDYELRFVCEFLKQNDFRSLGAESWSKVAILLPRNRWISKATKIFTEHGIDYQTFGDDVTARDKPTFALPFALMYYVANPWDVYEAFGVLHYLFGVDESELLEIRHEVGSLNFSDIIQSSIKLSKSFKTVIETLQKISYNAKIGNSESSISCIDFVNLCYEDANLQGRLSAISQVEDWQNFDDEFDEGHSWLKESAADADCSGLDVLTWISGVAENLSKINFAEQKKITSGAVQILTYHKAKGLEWDVVILPGIKCDIKHRKGNVPFVFRSSGEVSASFASGLPSAIAAKEVKNLRDFSELQRLFYVGMTRARRNLILVDNVDFEKTTNIQKSSFFALTEVGKIFATLPQNISLGRNLEIAENLRAEKFERKFCDIEELSREEVALGKKSALNFPHRVTPHSFAGAGEMISVDLVKFNKINLDEDESDFANDLDSSKGGRDYGIWWHELMQDMIRLNLDEMRDFVDSRIAEIAGDELRQRAAGEVEALLCDDFFRNLISDSRVILSELPFSYKGNLEDIAGEKNLLENAGEVQICEGVVDLVALQPSGDFIVVDWKTDVFAEKKDGEMGNFRDLLLQRYSGQLRAYLEFFRLQYPDKISRGFIYSTFLRSWIEVYSNLPENH